MASALTDHGIRHLLSVAPGETVIRSNWVSRGFTDIDGNRFIEIWRHSTRMLRIKVAKNGRRMIVAMSLGWESKTDQQNMNNFFRYMGYGHKYYYSRKNGYGHIVDPSTSNELPYYERATRAALGVKRYREVMRKRNPWQTMTTEDRQKIIDFRYHSN